MSPLVCSEFGSLSLSPLYRRCDSMTLLIKLTMAEAGCSGSNSANRWQTFSAKLPGFLATKPNTLRGEGSRQEKEDVRRKEGTTSN